MSDEVGTHNTRPAFVDVEGLGEFLGRRQSGLQVERWEEGRDARIADEVRRTSRSGRRVLHVLLIGNRAICQDPAFQDELARDREAGVRDLILCTAGMQAEAVIPPHPGWSFGLWDHEFLVIPAAPEGPAPRWLLSSSTVDVETVQGYCRKLVQSAVRIWEPDNEDGPDEPLFVSAPIARRICRDQCIKHGDTSDDCSWYHGIWQYLRIFDLVSTPRRHADFYGRTLRRLARDGSYQRVLIAGTADYSMLAHILWAYRAESANPETEALDLCDTPLELLHWYADRAGATVATRVEDILSFTTSHPFDAICTHSLLGRFAPSDRTRLIASWRRLLRPGGKVVTVNRIAPLPADEVVRFSPQDARTFCDRVFEQTELWRDLVDLDPAEIGNWAQEYAMRYRNYPIHSRHELLNLFESGGLQVEEVSWVTSAGLESGGLGPSTKQAAEYACLVVSRPDGPA